MADVVHDNSTQELPSAGEVEQQRMESKAERLDRLIAKHTKEVPDESEMDRTGEERTDPRPEAKKEKPKKAVAKAPKAEGKTEGLETEGPPGKKSEPKKLDAKDGKQAAKAEPVKGKATSEADEEDAEEKPEKRVPSVERARSLLKHGEVGKAITEAFGGLDKELLDDVREALARQLGVNSKQWETFRHKQTAERRRLEADRGEVTRLAAQVREEYAPLVEARELYSKGDFAGAIKAAFGDELNDYNRKLFRAHLSKDPELESVRRELEELKREKAEQKRREDQQQRQHHAQAEYARYAAQVHSQLIDSDDPLIADYAADDDTKFEFTSRVLDILEENYDRRTRMTIPVSVAAEQARDEKLAETRKWGKRNGAAAQPTNGEHTDRSGDSAKPAARAARSLRHSQAAEANTPVKPLTRAERIAVYTKRMESQIAAGE